MYPFGFMRMRMNLQWRLFIICHKHGIDGRIIYYIYIYIYIFFFLIYSIVAIIRNNT